MPEVETGAATALPDVMSVSEAASYLSGPPAEENNEPATPDAGAARNGSGDEPDAVTPEWEPSGETDGPDEAGEPPVDAPLSWTPEEKEAFALLPPDKQRTIADRERIRRAEIDRRFNEVATERKAIKAEKQAAEQARQQYEAALPNLVQAIEANYFRDFPDIKNDADVTAMRKLDPVRFLDWQARAQEVNSLRIEQQSAQERQSRDAAKHYAEFAEAETKRFLERAPEFADPAKSSKLAAEARTVLGTYGFSDGDIKAMWEGGASVYPHDHRFQLLIRDAMRWQGAQKALTNRKPAPVAPVQRPGVSTSKGEANAGIVSELTQKLDKSGSIKDAVALLRARRAS